MNSQLFDQKNYERDRKMKNALKLKRALLLLAVLLCITVVTLVSCGECDHDYEATVVDATCKEEGYTLHKCKECGDEYKDSTTAKLNHTYTEKVTKEPTCSLAGEKTLTCSACGDTKTESIAKDATKHHYVHINVVDPTCEENGYTSRTCECGDTITDTPTLAKGHEYTSVVTNPTCSAMGYTTHTCNCGDTYVDTYVQTTSHNYVAVVTNPTCSLGGYTTHTCSGCSDSYVDTYTEPAGHKWDNGTTTKTASCSVSGEITYKCTVDGCEETRIVNTGKTSHTYVPVVTAPTCTEDGYTTYTCICNHSYISNIVAKKGHIFAKSATTITPATCTEDGEAVYKCTGDNCSETKVEIIPHKGHNTEGNVAEQVNRVSTGVPCEYEITYKTKCNNENCDGLVTVETKEIHKYYWKIDTVATCTEDGRKIYICSVCQNVDPETEPESYSDDNAHEWDEGVTENGVTTYTCRHDASHTKTALVYEGNEATVDTNALTNTGSVKMDGAEFEFDSDVTGNLTGDNVTVSAGTVDDAQTRAEILEKAGKSEDDIRSAPIYNFLLKDGNTELHELNGYVTVTLPYELPDGEDANNIEIWYVDENGDLQTYSATYSNGYAIFTTNHFSHYIVVRYTPEQMCQMYPHIFVETHYRETCVRDGFTIKTCTRCGEVVREEGNKALGHSYNTKEVPATCFDEGYTEYSCIRCDHSYNSDYTDTLEHSWDEGVEVSATCVVKAHTLYTCQHGCGSTYTDNYTEFADHKWNAGTYTKAPTCTTSGISHYICTVCLEEKDEYVAELGHDYSEKTVEATCTDKGYVLHTCARCKDSYKDSYTSVVPHSWKDGVCSDCDLVCKHSLGAYTYNNDATCTENGTESATCIECGTVNTREKFGTAKGHSYENGICSSCGDGCTHSYGEFTYNNDATCTENGTKSHTCNNCKVTETLTVPDSAKGHSYEAGVCTVCGDECDHNYQGGVCKNCGISNDSFYGTFISSIFNADSYLIEVDYDVYEALMRSENSVELTDSKGKAYISLEFDKNGDPIVKLLTEATVISDGIEIQGKFEAIIVDGLMYNKNVNDYGNMTETEYHISQVDGLEMLSYLFGKKEFEGDMHEMSAMMVLVSSVGEFDFDMIGEPLEAILDMLLVRTKTENGYEISLDVEKLKALNNDLRDESVEVIFDRILGRNAFDKLLKYITESLDKPVYEVIEGLKNEFVESGKVTADDFDSLIENITGATLEEMKEEYPDVILGELLADLMELDGAAELKAMLKYYSDRFSELSVYELIEMVSGSKLDIWAAVNNLLDTYGSLLNLKMYTDADGNLINANIGLDIFTGGDEDRNSHRVMEVMDIDMSGVIKRNEVLDVDLSEIINYYPKKQLTIKGAPDRISKVYSLVTENGETIIVVRNEKTETTAEFAGSYNGKECFVRYEVANIRLTNYEVKLATATEKYCSISDWSTGMMINSLCNYDVYDVFTKVVGTEASEKFYARYYDKETGELVYEELLGENKLDVYGDEESKDFVFVYNPETQDLVGIFTNISYNAHGYEVIDSESTKCGELYVNKNTCVHCGYVCSAELETVKYHNYEFVAVLPDDADGCEDAIVKLICSECGEEAENVPAKVIETLHRAGHNYEEEYHGDFTVYKCGLCGSGYVEVNSWWGSKETVYVDQNGNEHIVNLYYGDFTPNYPEEDNKEDYPDEEKKDEEDKLLMSDKDYEDIWRPEEPEYNELGIMVAIDTYTVVDANGNATRKVDYYIYPAYDETQGKYLAEVAVSNTTQVGHQHVYKETAPKSETVDNGDGTVTVKNSMISVCPCGDTMEYREEYVGDPVTEKIYSQCREQLVNGVSVYYEKRAYVYIGNMQVEVLSEHNNNGNIQKSEYTLDENGMPVKERREEINGKFGSVYEMTYSNVLGEMGVSTEVTSRMIKQTYNGKLVSWTKESYSHNGCATTTVTEIYNSDGSIAYTKTKVLPHSNIREVYELAENSSSCTTGIKITEICMDCGEVVSTRVEYMDHDNEEILESEYYDYGMFQVEIYRCPCGEISSYEIYGEHYGSTEWVYDDNGNTLYEIRVYCDFDCERFFIDVISYVAVEGECCVKEIHELYSAEYIKPEELFVYDNNGKLLGLNSALVNKITELESYHYGYHDVATEEKTVESDGADGNKIVTKTIHEYCKNCDDYDKTVTLESVCDADRNVISQTSTTTNNITGEVESKIYLEIISENVRRQTSEEDGVKYIYTHYTYTCGSIKFCERIDEDGSKYVWFDDVSVNHSEFGSWEFIDPDSDSCEDGVVYVIRCRECGAKVREEHTEYWHDGRQKEEIVWEYVDSNGGVYGRVIRRSCVCEKELSYYPEYYNDMQEIPGENGRTYLYVFFNENGEIVYYFAEEYLEEFNLCHVTTYKNYYAGTDLESLNLIESVIIDDYDAHQTGEIVDTKDGVNGDKTTKTVVTTNLCTNCDYAEVKTEYYEYEDGVETLYKRTFTIDGEDREFVEIHYIYDSLGNRYTEYEEVKDYESREWRKATFEYDFANCSYTSTTTYYSLADGSELKSRDDNGECHVESESVYTLVDGAESCLDGVTVTRNCLRCNREVANETVYEHIEYLKDRREIATGCGQLVVDKCGCACERILYINVGGACEMTWLTDEYIDGDHVVAYRCFVTDCAYTYSIHYHNEYLPESCERINYVTYRFGVSDGAYTSDDGCDYIVTIKVNREEYHDCVRTELDSYGSYRNSCKNCARIIEEVHYDEYYRIIKRIYKDGEYDIEETFTYEGENGDYHTYTFKKYMGDMLVQHSVNTRRYDDIYGRITYEKNEEFENEQCTYWIEYWYRYEDISECEYREFQEGIDLYGDKYYDEWEHNNHDWCDHYLGNSCTQYNACVTSCRKCGKQSYDEYGSPTLHDYVADFDEYGEITGYHCMICGMTNDTGVNGYFILEDLSANYNVPAVGIYFPGLEYRVDWNVNFRIVISDGTSEREVSLEIPYTALYVYSSGTIIVDEEAYNNALSENLAEGEYLSEFIFAFSIYDEDSGTYLSHELILDMRKDMNGDSFQDII